MPKTLPTYEDLMAFVRELHRWSQHGNLPKYGSLMESEDKCFGDKIDELLGIDDNTCRECLEPFNSEFHQGKCFNGPFEEDR